MKKNIIISCAILGVLIGVCFLVVNKESAPTRDLGDIVISVNKTEYPFLKSLNNKNDYKKTKYSAGEHGIDGYLVSEIWNFEHEKQKYFVFQNNGRINANTPDGVETALMYTFALYDENNKLIFEIADEKTKHENKIYIAQRKDTGVKITAYLLDENNVVDKEIHKMLELPQGCEYISDINEYISLTSEQSALSPEKRYCIYNVDEYKFDQYSSEEIKQYINTPAEKERKPKKEVIQRDVPLNFWLINQNNLEELELKITLKNEAQIKAVKKSPRQIIDNMSVKLKPETMSGNPEKIKPKDYLKATEQFPKNDYQIKTLAALITENAKDDMEKVFLLMKWIDKNIAWTYDSNTEVLKTLETRKGDCSERAALFVTFARAIGIPADVTGGYLIKTNSLEAHAWAKVFIKNIWIEVDPSNPGLIKANYLSLDGFLFPKDIKNIQVTGLGYKGQKFQKINYDKPFTHYNKNFYKNRILGVSFDIPKYAQIQVNNKKTSGILFILKMKNDITNLSELRKNECIAKAEISVSVSDYYSDIFEAPNYAQNSKFNGAEFIEWDTFEQDSMRIVQEVYYFKNRYGLVYSLPIKNTLIINFALTGDRESINSLYRARKMPPMILETAKNITLINRNF